MLTVLGEFDPLNVFGHCADPKKALPCVIARNMRHSEKRSTDHFSGRTVEKK